MFGFLGRNTVRMLRYIGEVAMLAWETAVAVVVAPVRWRLVLVQIAEIGFSSQLVVVVTGAFTGAVFTAQVFFQFHLLRLDSAVGSLVSVAMFRELGPVLTGLMIAGRVGASIAAEIGTMKVTEQIDALRALGVQPIDYLVVPRALAMTVSAPLLVAESVGVGLLAAFFVGTQILGISEPYFVSNMLHFTHGREIRMALTKGFVFGLLIVFIACHQGLNAKDGAVGVGRAPTEAVVAASLAILILNFFLSLALNIVFPHGS